MGEVAGIYADGSRFPVEVLAGVVEILEGSARIVRLQEGAFAEAHALVEVVRAGIKPDDGADLREQAAILRRDDDAAAGGHDETDASDEAPQGRCFQLAEMLFAVLFENFGDGKPGFLGDEGVGVDEGESGERRKKPPHAGFAGSHETDEDHVAEHGIRLSPR